jgi:phage shock protein PspC (stress-responsive transcriptional regulator)
MNSPRQDGTISQISINPGKSSLTQSILSEPDKIHKLIKLIIMDKTININLGGILFQIDEEAFRILREYLQAINDRFGNVQGGHETIEDIEARIAEIFQSQRGLAGVITKENVEGMISIIGKPEDFDPGEIYTGGATKTYKKRRMYRNTEDTIIGGVCSGIAAYLDTDPVIFRIIFALVALFFGVGFLVYLALWIALPAAKTDSQKRELFGSTYHTSRSVTGQKDDLNVSETLVYHTGNNNPSTIANAINEVFRALGRVFYIIIRILLIIFGVLLVLTGFLLILSFVMVFIFKYPGTFSFDSAGVNLIYLPDFLNYIVNPSTVPWIIILASIAFILPMIALIYWGVKMIFWFRARDGVVSLIALVVWVMTIATLAIILFNEGTSYAQTGKASTETILPASPDTLYIVTDHKIAGMKYEKEISLPHEEYTVFLNDEKKELYIRPYLTIDRSEEKTTGIEVRKRSAARTEMEAIKKTEDLFYNYSLKGDSLKIDEYFTIRGGRKWSADNIAIHLSIPSGTILKFDNESRILVHSHFRDESDDYLESRWESEVGCWVMTDNGLEPVAKKNSQ